MNEQARDYRLDMLRVIALAMIILMHTPLPDSAPAYVLSGISYFTSPGIGLFFMISGALLLGNSLSTKQFLQKRFTKILFPTIFWTLFYLFFKYFNGQLSVTDLLRSVLSIPFSAQGRSVLWFMYTLAGLYLLTPILSQWIRNASKREIEFYLFLWTITLLYPYLEQILIINEETSGLLYYFSGYLGYFLLGFYLTKHYKNKLTHLILALSVAIVIPIVIYQNKEVVDIYRMLWYLSLPVALMAFSWFVVIRRCPNRKMTLLSEVSKLSFGIYLIHIFVMRNVLYSIEFIREMPGALQIPLVSISTFIMSFLVVWLISRVPYSKYIIGV